jgi:hypothetical protein
MARSKPNKDPKRHPKTDSQHVLCPQCTTVVWKMHLPGHVHKMHGVPMPQRDLVAAKVKVKDAAMPVKVLAYDQAGLAALNAAGDQELIALRDRVDARLGEIAQGVAGQEQVQSPEPVAPEAKRRHKPRISDIVDTEPAHVSEPVLSLVGAA